MTLPPSQQEPSQGELVAKEELEPLVSVCGRGEGVGAEAAAGGWCARFAPAVCARAGECSMHVQGPGVVHVREGAGDVWKKLVPGLCHLCTECLLAVGS